MANRGHELPKTDTLAQAWRRRARFSGPGGETRQGLEPGALLLGTDLGVGLHRQLDRRVPRERLSDLGVSSAPGQGGDELARGHWRHRRHP